MSNCDFKAKSIVILNRHIERVHKNNLKHLCSHCGKKFFRAYDLRCHIFRVHKDIQGKKLVNFDGKMLIYVKLRL